MGLVDKLDHPVVFVIFLTLAVLGVKAFGKWAFTQLGWDGPRAFFT